MLKFENWKIGGRLFEILENSKRNLPKFRIFQKLEEDKWMKPKWWNHFMMEANGYCKSIGKMCESTGWKKERWGVLIRYGPSLHALAMTIKVNRLLKQRREMDAVDTSTERRESRSPRVVRYYEPKLFRYHIPFLACCPFVL